MIKENLYHKTVDILVQAYFNDTLQHGNCYACAVGNMVMANMGITMLRDPTSIKDIYWKGYSSYGNIDGKLQNSDWFDLIKGTLCDSRKDEAHRQIESTGYSVSDIDKIETAFEGADYGTSNEDWMFNGLMAVIDVLDEIHENKDAIVTSVSKNKFQKC